MGKCRYALSLSHNVDDINLLWWACARANAPKSETQFIPSSMQNPIGKVELVQLLDFTGHIEHGFY